MTTSLSSLVVLLLLSCVAVQVVADRALVPAKVFISNTPGSEADHHWEQATIVDDKTYVRLQANPDEDFPQFRENTAEATTTPVTKEQDHAPLQSNAAHAEVCLLNFVGNVVVHV